MAFDYVNGALNTGTADPATTGTHSIDVSAGRLAVLYAHSNRADEILLPGSEGAAWNTAWNVQPGSHSARHACFWKMTEAGEPTAYTLDMQAVVSWQLILKVFTCEGDATVDAVASVDTTSSNTKTLVCNAGDGVAVAANALSIIAAGKDWRQFGGEEYVFVDQSYEEIVGSAVEQASAMAHRIWTEAGDDATAIIEADPDDNLSDWSYSGHISFVDEGGGGAPFPYHSIKQRRRGMKTLLTM